MSLPESFVAILPSGEEIRISPWGRRIELVRDDLLVRYERREQKIHVVSYRMIATEDQNRFTLTELSAERYKGVI